MLETERCYLNAFQKADETDVEKLYVNQDVRKYLGGVRDVDSILRALDQMLSPAEQTIHWVVREKQTDEFIGLISLNPHHDGDILEVSYQFLPDWWGKGYATETVQPIIDFALYELNQEKLLAETQTANKSSCNLLERLGMKLERKVFRFGREQAIYSISTDA